MDLENSHQQQDDSSNLPSSSGSVKRNEYVFTPYHLIKIKHKHQKFIDYPVSRCGNRLIATESNLFSLGDPRSTVSASELWSYNFATNNWKILLNNKDVPIELHAHALAIHRNILISCGGENYSNDCLVFTTERPRFLQIPVKGDIPSAPYGKGIVIHDNYVYMIGAMGNISCDVYRLSLKTKVWENIYTCRTEIRHDPKGRYGYKIVYDGHHIFIIGGANKVTDCDMKIIPAYNLETNSWDYFETKPDPTHGLPKPRKYFSCVHFDTPNGIEALITGELLFTLADVWKINLRTMQWSVIKMAVRPWTLFFHSATTSRNGCMYIFGGIEFNRTSKNMRHQNNIYKMWIKIPKLSEMCWDAITYYNPNLNKYNRNTLLKVGIPERFVNRVVEPVSTTKETPNSSAGGAECDA